MSILLSFSILHHVARYYLSYCVFFFWLIYSNFLYKTSENDIITVWKVFHFLYICQPQGFNLATFNSESQFDLKQKLILFVSLLWTSSTFKFILLYIYFLSVFALLWHKKCKFSKSVNFWLTQTNISIIQKPLSLLRFFIISH